MIFIASYRENVRNFTQGRQGFYPYDKTPSSLFMVYKLIYSIWFTTYMSEV